MFFCFFRLYISHVLSIVTDRLSCLKSLFAFGMLDPFCPIPFFLWIRVSSEEEVSFICFFVFFCFFFTQNIRTEECSVRILNDFILFFVLLFFYFFFFIFITKYTNRTSYGKVVRFESIGKIKEKNK